MVKPAGTGRPMRHISARLAPLPPSSGFIVPLPSVFLPKRYTNLPDGVFAAAVFAICGVRVEPDRTGFDDFLAAVFFTTARRSATVLVVFVFFAIFVPLLLVFFAFFAIFTPLRSRKYQQYPECDRAARPPVPGAPHATADPPPSPARRRRTS